jgi:hypothetical protein
VDGESKKTNPGSSRSYTKSVSNCTLTTTNQQEGQNLRKYFVLGGSGAAGFFSSLATIAAPDAMDPNAAIPSNSEWNRIVYVCAVSVYECVYL